MSLFYDLYYGTFLLSSFLDLLAAPWSWGHVSSKFPRCVYVWVGNVLGNSLSLSRDENFYVILKVSYCFHQLHVSIYTYIVVVVYCTLRSGCVDVSWRYFCGVIIRDFPFNVCSMSFYSIIAFSLSRLPGTMCVCVCVSLYFLTSCFDFCCAQDEKPAF